MLVFFLFTISIFSHNLGCISGANDTLVQGEKLSGNGTLVSEGNVFEFGFYTQDNTSYFLGTWVKNSSVPDGVVWVANTGKPVTNISLAELSISSEGDLVLKQSESSIWSSNVIAQEPISAIAMLLDNGNLVLKNRFNSSQIIWQSFDHPTDTWLPGAILGYDSVTEQNIFLSSGLYSLKYNSNTSYDVIISHVASDLVYTMQNYYWVSTLEGTIGSVEFLYSTGAIQFEDDLNGDVSFMKLDGTGHMNFMQWNSFSRSFTTLYQWGANNICDYSLLCANSYVCTVLYFRYKSCGCISDFSEDSEELSNNTLLAKWDNQCSKIVWGNCTMPDPLFSENEYFLFKVPEYPDNYRFQSVHSPEDCQKACSSNCSCIAYSYNTTCKIWNANFLKLIVPLDVPYEYQGDLQELLVRVGFGIPHHMHHKRNIIIFSILGSLSLLCAILFLYWRCHRRLLEVWKVQVDGILTLYSYFFIKRITRNFSDKLGEGGFGVVYKGTFPNSNQVAVKSLKGQVCEEKQFKTEIQTIGMIRHANLVRLVGFCVEGTKRMLVYEYMTNGSLDSHLFSTSQSIMTWNSRYHVALGTARGLAYLHEECHDCIIHCDIKPENILLDAKFCPKIADFGMAKLLGRDFSRALTTMRGTIGYLAPEWISGQPITQKADVYSFGMMLFEIISGKRNIEKIKNRECTYFPLYAAIKVSQGEILCLLDDRLEEITNVEELDRACKTACWCIQDFEEHRPSMGQVVHMLEGVVEVATPPVPRSLQNLVDIENDSLYSGESGLN